MTADTVTVHASAWGVQPLYYLQQGDSWLFCTSLARLVEASSRALHADWDAWASIMVMRHPIGEQTPFEEIRRIRPGGSLHFGHGSTRPTRRVGIPESTEPLARRLSPMDVAETVSRVVGRAAARALGEAPDGSVTLMLSGGWDSRMLGGVLARRMPGDAVRALTTTTHRDGFDADVAFSRAVADRLGIEQEVVDPEATSLPAYYRRAFRRVGYETAEHAWLEPAAALARSRRAPVFDGIAGDVLLKNRMASPIAMRGRTHRERGTLLWQRMAGKTDPRAPLLSAELAHHIRDRAREAFRTEWDLVDGHPE
ncbi:asparagine synthase-related protein, partial [Ornithinicoccus halotolerans]|uniref:asparagine synthase-related protein n=1 Tax=Ornithinicoccus halotolerans TaxID=1748220 RepID=UPI001885DA06